MARGRLPLVVCATAAAAVSAQVPQPFVLRSWDEAGKMAAETVKKMNATVLEISGLCQRQAFANNLLLQPAGYLQDGSAYYSTAGYYLYFEPSCEDPYGAAPRWTFSLRPPSTAAIPVASDVPCLDEAYTTEGDASSPPIGNLTWSVRCGWFNSTYNDYNFTTHKLNLRWVPNGEKMILLRGVGWEKPFGFGWWDLRKWWYIGNTPAIPRLGVPSLNMQDAAGGFRTIFPELAGTVTAWPSLLAMGATWDYDAVKTYGRVLGEEFYAKGANGILGPSVNVHRIARNGRNFEYLSGEDPYLGATLGPAYVEGVHSQGIFTVMKHWIFNEQETHRNSEDSQVDLKTAMELYLPPFAAVAKAGCPVTMCSYNLVGGYHSCSSDFWLSELRKLGFKGFVQSDWWATHASSIREGLDQEMPGIGSETKDHVEFFGAKALEKDPQAVDIAAYRILRSMYRMRTDQTTRCAPPNCKEYYSADVRSAEHTKVARELAAKSVVLLKNEGDVLPLTMAIRSIAIIGDAANASCFDPNGVGQGNGKWYTGDYYSGGGSGHVAGGAATVSVYQGLAARAEANGIEVKPSLSTRHLSAAETAAASADVAIIVAGATSGESVDRMTLSLDGGEDLDLLIDTVSKVNKRTVVLVAAPGAVTMPWRHSVQGIAVMFLGGQETGNAWADVLFGDVPPQGRLPVMMPETEWDAIPPSQRSSVPYSEGLRTSYRSNYKAAFPFGHGLTYTTFNYSAPQLENCTADEKEQGECEMIVRSRATNVGETRAPTTVQLYLQFPSIAGQPAPILKGFHKTKLLGPAESEDVVFRLKPQDMSYFDTRTKAWAKAQGTFVANIADSAADFKHSLTFCSGPCSVEESQNWLWMLIVGAVAVIIGGLVWRLLARRSATGAIGCDSESETDSDSDLESDEMLMK